MAFQPGRPKTGGRTKGVKNKLSCNLKDMMESFLTANENEFKKAWKKLPDEEKVRTYLKAIEFVIPKPKQESMIDDDPTNPGFTVILK